MITLEDIEKDKHFIVLDKEEGNDYPWWTILDYLTGYVYFLHNDVLKRYDIISTDKLRRLDTHIMVKGELDIQAKKWKGSRHYFRIASIPIPKELLVEVITYQTIAKLG